jgi:arabinogalactan endo-1,4-beta-galactosidase
MGLFSDLRKVSAQISSALQLHAGEITMCYLEEGVVGYDITSQPFSLQCVGRNILSYWLQTLVTLYKYLTSIQCSYNRTVWCVVFTKYPP